MAELITHKFPPTSHEARCVLACFYKELHMVSQCFSKIDAIFGAL